MLTGPGRTIGKARQLRSEMTLPEVLLWRALRQRPDGYKFRRQHPAGPFVLDFVCLAARLAIEVDGAVHDGDGAQTLDQDRDEWLIAQGFTTLRIPARHVLTNPDAVIVQIVTACRTAAQPFHHASRGPPPRSGEDF